ncbi:hypothetical protein P2H44_21195 [Albimonas sp. CAU 1670]|uniref:hypothetical protein n=1 Tax=Albimonas sp. CAU 1670 TaxID=3032599 RepID=UPI0023DCC1EA|nr:hypothetical protein [Albimonas sp. CAU 1670]MDF2235085.1 hypothetical protein [Albimonas sp. CAU 1670]
MSTLRLPSRPAPRGGLLLAPSGRPGPVLAGLARAFAPRPSPCPPARSRRAFPLARRPILSERAALLTLAAGLAAAAIAPAPSHTRAAEAATLLRVAAPVLRAEAAAPAPDPAPAPADVARCAALGPDVVVAPETARDGAPPLCARTLSSLMAD